MALLLNKFVAGIVAGILAAGLLFIGATKIGLLSALGVTSTSEDSQVIQAIERTQEVSLLSLRIQGIRSKDRSSDIFGAEIPGSTEKVILQYNFTAKLGIDGEKVKVKKTGAHTYRVTIPDFIFIGYDKPTFKVAAEDSGVLSWVTPDIDKVEMVNEILNSSAREKYVDSNEDLLQDQTKAFFKGIITSVDPAAKAEFDFS